MTPIDWDSLQDAPTEEPINPIKPYDKAKWDALPDAPEEPKKSFSYEDAVRRKQSAEVPIGNQLINAFTNTTRNPGQDVPVFGSAGRRLGEGAAALISTAPINFDDEDKRSYLERLVNNYKDIRNHGKLEDIEFAEKNPDIDAAYKVTGSMALPGPKGMNPLAGSKNFIGPVKDLPKLGERLVHGGKDILLKAGGEAGITGGDVLLKGGDLEQAGDEALQTGLMVGGLELGGRALSAGVKGYRKYGMGVKDETANAYNARRAEINAVDENEVEQQVNEGINRVDSELSTAKENFKGKNQALRDTKKEVSDKLKELENNRQIKIRELADQRRQDVGDLKFETKQNLLERNKPDVQVGEKLIGKIQDLRKQVSQDSAAAFDALAARNPDYVADLTPLVNSIEQKTSRYKVSTGNILPGAHADVDKLNQYAAFLDDNNGALTYVDLKKLVQHLDREIDKAYEIKRAGGHISAADRDLMDLRSELDGILKSDQAYSDLMGDVAEKTKILKGANKFFTSPETAEASLRGMKADDGFTKQKLGILQKVDPDTATRAQKYQRDVQTANNPVSFRNELEKSPLYPAPVEKHPKYPKPIQEHPEFGLAQEQMGKSRNELDEAERAVAKAKAERAKIGGLNPKTAQQTIRTIGSAGRATNSQQRYLSELGQREGKDFNQMAKDLGIKKSLSGGFQNGSKNVNLNAISAHGLGNLISDKIPWAAGGAFIGAINDLAGPKMYKFLSDLGATPAFQKYSKLLGEALDKGPRAFQTTTFVLAKQDPEFAQFLMQQQQTP